MRFTVYIITDIISSTIFFIIISKSRIIKDHKVNKFRFAELEEFCGWLSEREKPPEADELPPNMAELFEHFARNVKTLTNAEYNIFRYYMNGYEVAQIPTEACVSMSTVKKHNGNIYRKLEISSNEELMMYLDLFRRCDCIEKLQLDEKADLSEVGTTK